MWSTAAEEVGEVAVVLATECAGSCLAPAFRVDCQLEGSQTVSVSAEAPREDFLLKFPMGFLMIDVSCASS